MYDKRQDTFVLNWAKKLMAMERLGGKCTCGIIVTSRGNAGPGSPSSSVLTRFSEDIFIFLHCLYITFLLLRWHFITVRNA